MYSGQFMLGSIIEVYLDELKPNPGPNLSITVLRV